MAGIGFDLRKIFYTDNKLEKVKVSIQSLFITSGPWIISIFTVATLKIINETFMTKGNFNIFVSVIIYSFVFSLILSSPVTNLVTRCSSDFIYLEKFDEILSIFFSGFLIVGIISFLSAFLYILYFTPLKNYSFRISYLFTSLNILWFIMVFVSMLKDPKRITIAFLIGMLIIIFLNWLYAKGNLSKSLDSFTIGICFTCYYLIALLFKQFDFNKKLNFQWLFEFKYYPLVLSGLFLYLGMWADKIIYWFFSNKSVEVAKGFYFFPVYDFAIFLSYLTIIPTTAFFVIFIETTFYETQRAYLTLVERNGTLDEIREKEEKLIVDFYKSIINLIYFQSFIAIIFIFFVPILLDHFNIVVESIPLLRIAVLSATLQIILNIIIIFLYYFDYQKETLFIALCLFFSNTIISFYMKDMPFEYTGFSYFISLVITNIIAFVIAQFKLSNVTYFILMKNS